MELIWNPDLRRFEAKFHNFADEQPRVKKAGFKTDGPPTWVWYSMKATPLAKLREDRPAVLTISSEARTEFNTLYAVEQKNAETKAAMVEHKKALQKKLKTDKLKLDEYFDEDLQCVCLKIKPAPSCPVQSLTKIAPPPETLCVICGCPVYDYEYIEVKACLWCQKIVLDNAENVC